MIEEEKATANDRVLVPCYLGEDTQMRFVVCRGPMPAPIHYRSLPKALSGAKVLDRFTAADIATADAVDAQNDEGRHEGALSS